MYDDPEQQPELYWRTHPARIPSVDEIVSQPLQSAMLIPVLPL
jgi:hypothetical protein